jgi:O-antigen ligase/tetratricopeptide (TPR) repeat protein
VSIKPTVTRIFRSLPEPSWRAVILALLVATLLVPVIVGSDFFFPYVVPRNLYFRVLVEIAITTLVVAMSLGRKKLDLRGEPILWALTAFVAAAFLSALSSPARMHSLFGDFERMGGVWAWLHLVLFFLLLRTLRDEDWPWMLNAALLVSLFVSVNAIVQHVEVAGTADITPPSMATIGNSGLLAAYLVMTIAIAAYLASTSVRFRLLYLSAGAVDVLGLLYAENRSTLIGLVLGSVVGAVIYATISTKSKKKWIVPAVAVGVAAIVFGLSAFIRVYPQSALAQRVPGVLERLAGTSAAGSDDSRLLQWRAAIEGFRDRPLLGYGIENHNIVWSRHFDPHIYSVVTDIFDRTHNQYLEVLATTGIVGTLAFLAIWIAIGVTLVRGYRAGRIPAPATAVLWALQMAYATYLFFWFFDLNSTMLWIAIAALISSRATIGSVVLEATSNDPQPVAPRPWLAAAAMVLLALTVFREGYTPLVADRTLASVNAPGVAVSENLSNLIRLARSPAHQTAHTPIAMSEYLSSLRPRFSEMRRSPAEQSAVDHAFSASFASFAKEIQRDSLNDRLYTREAELFADAAEFYGSPTYRQEAIDAFHKAIELSPHRIEQRLGLANLYMDNRDYERAVVVLTDAVKADPLIGVPRYELARAYIGSGKSDSALAMLETSLRLGYVGAPDTYLAMGKRLEFGGRGGAAAALYSDYLEAKYTEAVWDRSEIIDRPIPTTDLALAAHLPLLYMRASESELAVKSAAALSVFDPSRTAIVDRFVSDVGRRRRGNWVARSSLLPCTASHSTLLRDSTALNACGVFRRKL